MSHGSGVANERPANPVACFCGGTADDSPSPGGEGRGEVEPPEPNFFQLVAFVQRYNRAMDAARAPAIH